jgi:hypothetical protein
MNQGTGTIINGHCAIILAQCLPLPLPSDDQGRKETQLQRLTNEFDAK